MDGEDGLAPPPPERWLPVAREGAQHEEREGAKKSAQGDREPCETQSERGDDGHLLLGVGGDWGAWGGGVRVGGLGWGGASGRPRVGGSSGAGLGGGRLGLCVGG